MCQWTGSQARQSGTESSRPTALPPCPAASPPPPFCSSLSLPPRSPRQVLTGKAASVASVIPPAHGTFRNRANDSRNGSNSHTPCLLPASIWPEAKAEVPGVQQAVLKAPAPPWVSLPEKSTFGSMSSNLLEDNVPFLSCRAGQTFHSAPPGTSIPFCPFWRQIWFSSPNVI